MSISPILALILVVLFRKFIFLNLIENIANVNLNRFNPNNSLAVIRKNSNLQPELECY